MNPHDQSNFNPYGEVFKRNPFPMLTAMRRDTPIYQVMDSDGKRKIWYITRYADADAVLRDHKRFINDARRIHTSTAPAQLEPPAQITRLISENMLSMDGHDHSRLRTLVSKAFTNKMVQQLRPRVQQFADDLLDQVAGRHSMDLVDDFALPLPIMVILEMLGIPTADRDRMRLWSKALINPPDDSDEQTAAGALIQELIDYLGTLFTTRRHNPQNDLISALVQAEEAGDTLREGELYSMVLLLIIAGHETTVKLIGTGMLALLQHPDQLARLRAEPALIGSAIEEVLRYCGPTDLAKTRFAAEDVELGGHLIRRGDLVRVLVNSANRDEAHFAAADSFAIERQNNQHLGFGLGIHYCLGAPLARLEGQIAISTLLRRFPNLRLAVPVDGVAWDLKSFVYGVKHLPVAWG